LHWKHFLKPATLAPKTSITPIDQQESVSCNEFLCADARWYFQGPVFLAWDLPVAIEERDELLLNLMGSGHELEIDGIGGGSPQTSKVAIVSPSLHPMRMSTICLSGHGFPASRRYSANCGNMLCAVSRLPSSKGWSKPQI
jgi:2-methylaconitate cis-trans-isomerase PrpF